jgi:hypothetical protein
MYTINRRYTNYSVFKNVRLVCRLRKSSPSRTPTIPSNIMAALSSSQTAVNTATSTPNIPLLSPETLDSTEIKTVGDTPLSSATPVSQTPSMRYFIMKSLMKEDLVWSVANKVWATQPHNENILNDAFRVNFLKPCSEF